MSTSAAWGEDAYELPEAEVELAEAEEELAEGSPQQKHVCRFYRGRYRKLIGWES